jgi:hypothetical protein
MLTKMLVGDFEGGIVRAVPLLHIPPTTHGRAGPAEAGCGRGRVDGQGRRIEELVVVFVRSARCLELCAYADVCADRCTSSRSPRSAGTSHGGTTPASRPCIRRCCVMHVVGSMSRSFLLASRAGLLCFRPSASPHGAIARPR